MRIASNPSEWWVIGTNFAVAGGTLLVAVVAALVAIRDGRHRDAERRDRESAQARLVTCVLAYPDVQITNHSGLPLLDAQVVVLFEPEARILHVVDSKRSGTIKAHDRWLWPIPHEIRSKLEVPVRESLVPSIRFMDASGVEWERQGNGQRRPRSAGDRRTGSGVQDHPVVDFRRGSARRMRVSDEHGGARPFPKTQPLQPLEVDRRPMTAHDVVMELLEIRDRAQQHPSRPPQGQARSDVTRPCKQSRMRNNGAAMREGLSEAS